MASEKKLTQHGGSTGFGAGRGRMRDSWVGNDGRGSYDDRGRAASSSQAEGSYFAYDKGEHYSASNQYKAAMETFRARDARCTQGTQGRDKPYLKKHEA